MAYDEKQLGQFAKKGKGHCQGLIEVMERRLSDPRFTAKHPTYTEQIEQLKKLIDAL